MTDQSAPKKEARPSPINGPAFLVFGLLFVVLGVSNEGLGFLIFLGVSTMAIGAWGIIWQRRYERVMGIEVTLPGKSPSRSQDTPKDE